MPLMRIAVLAAIALIGGATMATAADLRPAYKGPPPAPPPPVSDWSGIYSGFEGGYGWGHQSFDPAFSPDFNKISDNMEWLLDDSLGSPSIDSVHQKGWLFGGFVGAQKQWGSWVVGIEADYDTANIKGSATSTLTSSVPCQLGVLDCSVTRSLSLDSKIDGLGSVRSKTGWAFAPNWLVYWTGGVAFAHVKETVTLNQTVNYPGDNYSGTTSFLGGASMLGWSLGAGIDWRYQIDQGSSWVFGLEYLHYGFPANTITVTDNIGAGSSFSINTKESVDTIKARISYLFSIH